MHTHKKILFLIRLHRDSELVNLWRTTKYKMLSPHWYTYNIISLHLRLREHQRSRKKDLHVCCEIVFSIYDRETAPRKSQKYGCLRHVHQWQQQLKCLHDWGKNLTKPHPGWSTIHRQWWLLRKGKSVFFRHKLHSMLLNLNWLAPTTYAYN